MQQLTALGALLAGDADMQKNRQFGANSWQVSGEFLLLL
jgi:hypothetical protein